MINCCLYGVPPGHVYKGVEEGERAGPYGAPGGVLLPPGVGFPPFQVVGVGDKEGGREEKEGGGAAPGQESHVHS